MWMPKEMFWQKIKIEHHEIKKYTENDQNANTTKHYMCHTTL